MEILKFLLPILILLVAGVYCAFLIAVYIGFVLRNKNVVIGDHKPAVTVVVAARDEEKNIGALLNALNTQTYPEKFDVIIADDHSSDATAQIVRDFQSEKFRVRVLFIRGVGKKAALTEAIESAVTGLILVTDADCVPGKRWVELFVDLFSDGETEFAAGMVKYTDEDRLLRHVLQTEMNFLQIASAASKELGHPIMCNGASMAFTRNFFDEVGGFSDNNYVSGDDVLLLHKAVQRNKHRVKWNYAEEALVETTAAPTIAMACEQRHRWLSKFKGYESRTVIFAGYLFLAVQLLLPAYILWSLNQKVWINALGYAVGMKILVELLFLSLTAPVFREHKIIPVFPLSVVLYEVISLGAALRTFLDDVTWKGRAWRKGKQQ